MPKIGEIRRAKEIRPEMVYKSTAGLNKYVWAACVTCGKERWTTLRHGVPFRLHCQQCGCGSNQPTGSGNPAWKGVLLLEV